MIQQIAIGETTGKIYARGTHAECSRRLNKTKNFLKEPIRIVRAEREYELLEKQIQESVPVKREKKKYTVITWTDEKNHFVHDNQHLQVKILTKLFNEHFNEKATTASINTKRNNMKNGIVTTKESNKHLWTQEDEDFIRTHYKTLTDSEIGKKLGRSSQAVGKRALHLGLREKRVLGK